MNEFSEQIKDAFETFKLSTELEQVKRMRQIGDFISNQQRVLGQISMNDKNYQIFQKTGQSVIKALADVLDILRLQNCLNICEERDKSQISLYGAQAQGTTYAEIGSKQDKKGA